MIRGYELLNIAAAGADTLVAVPAPPSGRLFSLILKQTAGDNTGLTVTALTSAFGASVPVSWGRDGADPPTRVITPPNGGGGGSGELYRIMAPQNGVSGLVQYYEPSGAAYQNAHVSQEDSPNYIYVLISLTDGTGATFDLRIQVEEASAG